MTNTETVTRPLLPNTPNGYVDLPAHKYNAEGICKHCRYNPKAEGAWASYDEYEQAFWDETWEGEPGHRPWSREFYNWIEASCSG